MRQAPDLRLVNEGGRGLPVRLAEVHVEMLQRSAIDLGPKGLDSQYGAGRADAVQALGSQAKTGEARD